MRSKRKYKGGPAQERSILYGLRKAVTRHLIKNSAPYAPALSPLFFFFLAHIITLLALFCMQTGILQKDQMLYKTMVTWAVYGFLPFLLCSYVSFYCIARPVADLLERRFPFWSSSILNISSGGAYGLAIGLFLVLLLKPHTVLSILLLLLIGLAAGQGNWFFYRKLVNRAA